MLKQIGLTWLLVICTIIISSCSNREEISWDKLLQDCTPFDVVYNHHDDSLRNSKNITIHAGTEVADSIISWLNNNKDGWKWSPATFQPDIILRHGDFTLFFTGGFVVANVKSSEGHQQYVKNVDVSSYSFLINREPTYLNYTGGKMFYDSLGGKDKWFWYGDGDINDVPIFGLYFDSIGEPYKIGGSPFIRKILTTKNEEAVEIVSPPIEHLYAEYRDYLDGRLIKKQVYEPYITDSTAWVNLGKQQYDSSHNYYLYFVVFNSLKNMVVRDSTELK